MTEQFTKEQAIAFAKSGLYKTWPPEIVAFFQLKQDKLCMDFDYFHECIEKALGRPVWTHEFVKPDLLLLELAKVRKIPTLAEIMGQIPKEKLIMCFVDEDTRNPSNGENKK